MKITLVLLFSVFVFSGCNIGTAVIFATAPEPSQEALYKLKQDEVTAVFVDDRRNIMQERGFVFVIAEAVNRSLEAKNLCNKLLPSRKTIGSIIQKDTYSEPLTVEAIGQLVGATQVIYIKIDAFGFVKEPRKSNLIPVSQASVKVIDLNEKKRVFPNEALQKDWHTISAKIERINPLQAAGETRYRREQLVELSKKLGEEVARIFYDHYLIERGDPSSLGNRLQRGR